MTDFVANVRAAGGFTSEASAERAIVAVLEALSAQLAPPERDLITAALPRELAARLPRVVPAGPVDVDDVIRDVAARLGVSPGTAKEQLEVVLAVAADRLDAEARARLERDLPPALFALFAPLPVAAAAELGPHHPVRPRRQTLASGRPWTEHPLSEARPGTGHTQSVAADNPHGDTKLSSTSGSTQERTSETLATGAPGNRRPVRDVDE